MSSFNIALKNIKKSRSDYSVYFFTLIIGVSIFYMFNSIGTQGIMADISRSKSNSITTFVTLIRIVSVGVAVVLGLLMIYANNFLIKRRKKEFGIYMLLGMGTKKVSKILVCETCLVGLVSLAVGLVIGVFGSQFLSILVTRMFEFDVTEYTFVFSMSAFFTTIISFVIIFLVVLAFNTKTVAGYKLIDLINADKKTETKLIRNNILSIVLFVISALVMSVLYIRIGFYGEEISRNEFIASIILGIICTFTLFWSGSGFMQETLSKSKKIYSKGLNSFVIRQFSGNMNTSAVSMAAISLLLFLALCFFSTGFSVRTYLNKRLGNATPVDINAITWTGSAVDVFKEYGLPVEDWAEEYIELPIYESQSLTIADTMGDVISKAKERFRAARWDSPDNVMKISDFNRLERMYEREELQMADDEYIVVSDFDLLNEFTNEAMAQGNVVNIGNRKLSPAYDKVVEEYIVMSGMSANLGVILLPDEVIDDEQSGFNITGYLLSANYKAKGVSETMKTDALIEEKLGIVFDDEANEKAGLDYNILSLKNDVQGSSVGTSVIVVFLVLYIGIVFVISCAAILALKILSDSIDSIKKYEILTRIGADSRMRGRALFTQVFLIFSAPLLLAILDTLFAVRYIKGLLRAFGVINMASGIVVTLVIMLIVYGGYFLTTYEGCKKIIKI